MSGSDDKNAPQVTGYLHPAYAESLAEFGVPCELPRSRGWILRRQIAGVSVDDAMGCYPIFACRDWSKLEADLQDLDDQIVSLSLVTDPFGAYEPATLKRCFPDRVVPFKEHFVANLAQPLAEIVSPHHRYYAQRAKQLVKVERCPQPEEFLDEWVQLYENLTARHELRGIKAFSRTAFAAQLRIPGLVMLRATHEGETVGAHLWFAHGEVAHSHLSAFSEPGYKMRAAYALNWFAIETFSQKMGWLDFGGGAGLGNVESDGLVHFKSGWATEKRTAYFCGRIFDHEKYAEILESRRITNDGYFPAYRQGEFT